MNKLRILGTSIATLVAECDATAPARCTVGTAIVDVRLVDRAGNESAPIRVTITFQ
jgi:hypothetical protein